MFNKRTYRTGFIRDIVIRHIGDNFIEYIIMILLFLIGIILGTMYINNTDLAQKQELTTYINDFMTDIKNGSNIDLNSLLKTSISNNLIITILLWIAGLTVIGMPILYLIISAKGFFMGYTVSAIIATLGIGEGIKFIISTMLLQNIIIIPSMLFLAVSGIRLYKDIMKDRRRENIRIEIVKYTVVSIAIGIINLIAALIETYISANLFRILFI